MQANHVGGRLGCHGLRMADLRRIGWLVDVGRLAGGGSVLLRGADRGGEGGLDFRRASVFGGCAALRILEVGVRALADEILDDVGVAEASGNMEGGQPALVHFIDVAASALHALEHDG